MAEIKNPRKKQLVEDFSNVPLPACAFNVLALEPVSCEFRVGVRQMEKAILELAQSFIPEFHSCTIECNLRKTSGYPEAYLWIPAKSENVVDSSLKNDPNTFLKADIARYSEKLKNFMGMFCDKQSRYLMSEDHGMPYKACRIDLTRVIDRIFDGRNVAYNKVYQKTGNTAPKVQCIIDIEKDKNDNLTGFVVRKRLPNLNEHGKLTARKGVRV